MDSLISPGIWESYISQRFADASAPHDYDFGTKFKVFNFCCTNHCSSSWSSFCPTIFYHLLGTKSALLFLGQREEWEIQSSPFLHTNRCAESSEEGNPELPGASACQGQPNPMQGPWRCLTNLVFGVFRAPVCRRQSTLHARTMAMFNKNGFRCGFLLLRCFLKKLRFFGFQSVGGNPDFMQRPWIKVIFLRGVYYFLFLRWFVKKTNSHF